MIFTPRPYQTLIRDWILEHPRCCVWAEPGMGKTSSTYSALDLLWLAGSHYWPALIIAPLRVARDVWPFESKKFDDFKGLRVSAMIGSPAERAAALRAKADVYCINFENIEWLFDQLKNEKVWPFRIVVVDEATRLKGFRLRKSTKRASALAAICGMVGRWVNLTGTPAPNGYIDLWGQLYFIDQGARLMHSYTDFTNRWFDEIEEARKFVPKPFAEAEINERLKDVCITVRAKDWFDLKEPVISKHEVELPRKARELYREFAREMYAELDCGARLAPANAAGASAKCLQLASGAVLVEDGKEWREVHQQKIEALDGIVHEINGAPLIVGYWWAHDKQRLMKAFPYARTLKTKADEDAWNEGRIPMLLCHYQSVGHGLNLQHGGHRIAHFSRWWDIELDDQLRARIGPVRQAQAGLDRNVFEYNIVARDTHDELLMVRHQTKREVQDLLMDATARRY